jgi:hypothetical protein
MFVELNMSLFENELRSPLQLEGTNKQNIYRLFNYNNLSIQFLCIQYISYNPVSF